MGPGGPYEIHVTSPKYGKISLVDVMFGDVWVCSGQSNMAFLLAHVSFSFVATTTVIIIILLSVAQAFNATAEIQAAGDYPNIRLFTAKLMESPKPEQDLLGVVQPWQIASPGKFSATS